MKRCPTCQRTYPDDAPGFCVNDGMRLVDEEPSAYDPLKTIMASAPAQYSNPAPPNSPPSPPPQQQPAWSPPPQQPQAQHWGGQYQTPPGQVWPPQNVPQAGKSKTLSLIVFIVGLLSGLLTASLMVDFFIRRFLTRKTGYPILIAALATGGIAIILGLITLFSSRQRGKVIAVIGLFLSLVTAGFYIYLETKVHIFF
jgi:hypothetical protein